MPRRSVVVTAACCAAAAACLLPPSAAQDPADEVARRLRQWEADPTRRPLPALTLPPPGRAVPPPAARDATATGRRWSLHAGVNKLHPGRYPGVPELEAAEDDARTLAAAAQASGFEAKLLVGEAATVAAVLAEVDRAVAGLQRGDLFIMTFAGHGALVEDYNGDQAPRKTDQAFCLFDRMLVDDEVVVRWGAFQPGVRVLILLDSCHSGTSPTAGAQLETKKRGAGGADDPLARLAARSVGSPAVPRVRALRSEQHTTANQVQEAELRAATSALDPAGAIERTRATILRIAACRADQTALEAGRHGLFTQTLIEIWNSGRFTGTYRDLVTQAGERTSPYQEPTLDYYGEEVQSFLRGQSFR